MWQKTATGCFWDGAGGEDGDDIARDPK